MKVPFHVVIIIRNNYSCGQILSPIADELIIANIKMPVTIIYSSLEMYGVGYAFLERKLGDHQFDPTGAPQIPQNRLFAHYFTRHRQTK